MVGFTEYSFDEGKNWIKIPENHYVVGIWKWGDFYVALFNVKATISAYTPKE